MAALFSSPANHPLYQEVPRQKFSLCHGPPLPPANNHQSYWFSHQQVPHTHPILTFPPPLAWFELLLSPLDPQSLFTGLSAPTLAPSVFPTPQLEREFPKNGSDLKFLKNRNFSSKYRPNQGGPMALEWRATSLMAPAGLTGLVSACDSTSIMPGSPSLVLNSTPGHQARCAVLCHPPPSPSPAQSHSSCTS